MITAEEIAHDIVANNFGWHDLGVAVVKAIEAERQAVLDCGHPIGCLVGPDDDRHCGWCSDISDLLDSICMLGGKT